jgi:hypothetical protein
MTRRYESDEDYDRMVDDYLTGENPYPVTRRQKREADEAREAERYGW